MSSQSTGLSAQKEVGGGGTSCLMFATWKQYGNFAAVVANSLCLQMLGAFYRRKGSVQVKEMWKTLFIRWQFLENLLSLLHKAHFLLGKERPTVLRLTWSLCPLSCSSQFLDQITEVFSFGLCQTLLSFHRSLLCLDWFQGNSY